MTEQDWLTGTDPQAMLAWLTNGQPGHVPPCAPQPSPTDRKLRLFACAVWRGHPAILARYGSSDLPEISERLADGEATEADLVLARARIRLDVDGGGLPYPTYVRQTARHMARVLVGRDHRAAEEERQADLLRCLFGNPLGPVPSLAWLEEAYGASAANVLFTAQAIYEENRWGDLAILADALEEAGCPAALPCPRCGHKPRGVPSPRGGWVTCSACGGAPYRIANPLLLHLRDEGPHGRGCWVVDLLLGKD